eukprot:9999916-Lingulodinium_polyedra.AAC.1
MRGPLSSKAVPQSRGQSRRSPAWRQAGHHTRDMSRASWTRWTPCANCPGAAPSIPHPAR